MSMSGTPQWVVLAWRLPAGLSTPRVTTWRNLQRLGAARLTPGAAVLPFREDLQEQLDWLAQDIEQQGGEAWVLPVTLLALQRRFRKIRARDYVHTPARAAAAQAIDRCLSFRQGISPKVLPVTDAEVAAQQQKEEDDV